MEGTYTHHSPAVTQPTAASAITHQQQRQQLCSPWQLLAAVSDALSSWLSWSVMAGLLYLLRQWLVPYSPALDFGLALLIRTPCHLGGPWQGALLAAACSCRVEP